MVVEFFEVVVGGSRWLQVVLAGCRLFLLLVTTRTIYRNNTWTNNGDFLRRCGIAETTIDFKI